MAKVDGLAIASMCYDTRDTRAGKRLDMSFGGFDIDCLLLTRVEEGYRRNVDTVES